MSALIMLVGMAVGYGTLALMARIPFSIEPWLRRHDTDWRLYAGIGVVLFVGGYLS